jgi:hypothetical protein
MRANMWGMTCLALVAGWTVSLLAQGGPTTQKNSGETVAVIGCIAKATTPPAGRGGSANTTGSSSATGASYVLTKVTPAPADVMPANTSSGQARPATASQYRLTGPDSMIGPYDGHQVQITGTTDSSASAGAANVPTLKVDTVYMKSNTCP